MRISRPFGTWTMRGAVLLTALLVACAPAAQPSPTAPQPAKPAATTAPAKPAESKPAAKEAAKPAATTAPAKAAAKEAGKPATKADTKGAPAAKSESLDELYQQAKQEGGTLSYYGTLAQINAQKLLPVFEQRFPGIKVDHIDATADKLAARIITEARGGRVLADVYNAGVEHIPQLREQQVVEDYLPPESSEYPETLKGPYWVATDLIFIIPAWNTNVVKEAEAPKTFDDFADPKWKGKIIAEPRDVEVLIGLARHKYKSDEQALDVIRRVAANNPEFHKGHSDLAELLVAGQAATCFTCYSHHYPPRIKKGAPVGYSLTEGAATIIGNAVIKGAPHPNTARLWTRWITSQEGQKAMAEAGRTPAHPKVEPVEKTRPENIYPIGVDEIQSWDKYEKQWKEIFQLR